MESSPSTETRAKTADSETSRKTIPFKLCFPIKQDMGRSGRNYPTIVPTLAPKFYSRAYASFECSEKNLQHQVNKLKFTGPREKFQLPNTESQRYGWYQVRLSTPDKSDKRMNFAKNTHQLIKEQLMNYAKIREES